MSVGWKNVLGSALLFVMVLQLLTGAFMMLYYAPTPDHALDSVRTIEAQHFGKLVRGLHVWGASFAVVLLLLHVVRVFVQGAYRPPREVNWLLGVGLIAVILGFAFTGYLLPWDQKAYWATVVGTEVIGTAPVIGEPLLRFVRGGDEVGALTLIRFFALHVIFLPAALIALVVGHIVLLRRHGAQAPPGWHPETDPSQPFAPNQLFRDTATSFVLFVALVLAARLAPPILEAPADPADSDFVPRPEWYFLSLFQLLKVFEGPLEVIGTVVLPALIIALLVALPFIDQRSTVRIRTILAAAAVALVGLLTFLGWLDRPQPVGAEATPSGPAAVTPATPLELAGRSLVDEVGCGECHRENESGEAGAGELAGARRRRDDAWLYDHCLDPAAAAPELQFEMRELIDEEIRAIMAYVGAIEDGDAPVLDASPIELRGGRMFFDYVCIECHTVYGAGGDQGPDLSRIGSEHERDWLREQILHPRRHRPEGKMPPFAGKIEEADLQAVLDYLETLR